MMLSNVTITSDQADYVALLAQERRITIQRNIAQWEKAGALNPIHRAELNDELEKIDALIRTLQG